MSTPGVHKIRTTQFYTVVLIYVRPQYGTCFISPSWCLEFCGGSQILEKFVNTISVGKL
jgi:hypothetical protein